MSSGGQDVDAQHPPATVYAAFAGTWKKIIRGVRHGSLSSTWAPGRTGGGGLIANPDGEGNGYNHVDVLDKWDEGDWINAGDLIGYNDTSGNQSGPHLHFELWADWEDSDSDYDPQDAFAKFKVKPGSKPALGVIPSGSVKPKPSKPAAAKLQHGYTRAQVNNIIRAMNRMGLKAGVEDVDYGSMLTAAVKAFQKHHGLVADGIYGKKTQARWFLNRKIQTALRKQGYTKQTVDGWIGDQTTANVRDFQKRVGLVQDGDPGTKTQKKLGL